MSARTPIAPQRTKATIAERKRRVTEVLDMLTSGVAVGQIQEQLSQEWGCSQRSIRRYITECRQRILPSWYEWSDQRVIAAELIAKLDRCYAAAFEAGNYQAAVRALRQQAELYGLNSARMIAKERDSLAMQLEQLRKGEQGEAAGKDAPFEQANAIRAVYGQHRFATVEEYQVWVAALAPAAGRGAPCDG